MEGCAASERFDATTVTLPYAESNVRAVYSILSEKKVKVVSDEHIVATLEKGEIAFFVCEKASLARRIRAWLRGVKWSETRYEWSMR